VSSTIEMHSSSVRECQAAQGGGVYLGNYALAVLTDVVIRDTVAQSGSCIYMEDSTQMQTTHVKLHTHADSSSSVLRLAARDSAIDSRLPLRGLLINSTGCNTSMPLVDYDVARVTTPLCADGLYYDIASKRGEGICGPNAKCTDMRLHPSIELSTPTCSCDAPFYTTPGSQHNSHVTPYVTTGGCVSAPHAVSALVVTNRLTFEVSKHQLGSATSTLEFVLRMVGSDVRDEMRALWSAETSGALWLSLPRYGGTVDTRDAGAWDVMINVSVSATGLREQSEAYVANVFVNVAAPADTSQDRTFVVPVQLYVSSTVVGATSGWGLAANYSCSTPGSQTWSSEKLILGAVSEIAFQACDADGLPVDHKLPQPMGTGSDNRRFRALLLRESAVPSDLELRMIYSGNGAYRVQLSALSLGNFSLTMHLGLDAQGEVEQIDAARRVEIQCPELQKPLASDSLSCGVEAGFTISDNGEPVQCQPGFAKATIGNQPCSPCAQGHYAPTAGAQRCQQCPVGFIPGAEALACEACELPTSAWPGSASCSICTALYYQQNVTTTASLANCQPCGQGLGLDCSIGTTLETIIISPGFWRHTARTAQALRCRSDGAWSPCLGGTNAGAEGDGYCAEGYGGPRCELCISDDHFFDKLDARCHNCGNAAQLTAVFCCVAFGLIAALGGAASTAWRRGSAPRSLLKWIHMSRKLWRRATMRHKVKVLIGLFQCTAAIPVVFDVTTPANLHQYTKWLNLLELPAEIGFGSIIQADCFGSYRTVLLIGGIWPIILLLIVTLGYVFWELAHDQLKKEAVHRTQRAAVRTGFKRSLPIMTVLTFILVPSTATTLFKTFLCDPVEYDSIVGITRRYHHEDLKLSCDSYDYTLTSRTAVVLIFIWPIGVPLLYALLLWASRDALRTGNATSLSRATDFLSADYKSSHFWWEPLEMCRKLALTGWILLIGENFEQARVLVAICVSIAFQAIHLSIQPLRRAEDGVLVHSTELALIFIYLCVLLIKSCDMSSVKGNHITKEDARAICTTFGFGDSADGAPVLPVPDGRHMHLHSHPH